MSDPRWAVDTSVAVPLLVRTHPAHQGAVAWTRGKELCLSGHAAAETYSVLTRLPAGIRATGAQAAQVIDAAFAQVLTLPPALAGAIHRELAECGISGGAVYDALVGLAAREHRIPLATRDARARGTYGLLGVPVLVVADSAETGRG